MRIQGRKLYWGAAFLAALLVGCLLYWVNPTHRNTEGPIAHPQSTTGLLQLSDFTKLLSRKTPIDILVIGDATGNGPDDWVHLLARRIADTGRYVAIRDWNLDASGYGEAVYYGAKDGKAVSIWNGSVSGLPSSYAADRWRDFAPKPNDLVMINHGHNETNAETAVEGISRLVRLSRTEVTRHTTVAVILQNPRIDRESARLAAIVSELRRSPDLSNAEEIDVNSAFAAQPNLGELLSSNGFHPNQRGEELWAQVVSDRLGLT
ncbi:MAG TPA: SGNH/GDSL hydrolase family protein [Sphingomicrobium sp.]|nr:SGNH/GDSL hydrolase family protein [Sphingomicrobium sp.]